MNYILSASWLKLLDRMGNYVIRLGGFEQVLVMNNIIITFTYTYSKRRLKQNLTISAKLHTDAG